MPVRGVGIRDVSEIERIIINKVLSVLVNSNYVLTPQRSRYDRLEIDEFWTYVGNKQNKVWLIYAYHRDTGEIVAYVWGKRNLKTSKSLRDKLSALKVSYDSLCTDNWEGFLSAFKGCNHLAEKEYTVGIEGNNCRIRHRVRRAFR